MNTYRFSDRVSFNISSLWSHSRLLQRAMLPTLGTSPPFPQSLPVFHFPQFPSHLGSSTLSNSEAVLSFRNVLNTSSAYSPMKDEFTRFTLMPFHDRGFFLKDLEALGELACLLNIPFSFLHQRGWAVSLLLACWLPPSHGDASQLLIVTSFHMKRKVLLN